jgi:type II secretory pathway component PulC
MNLKIYLLLINICITALILWVASNIVLTWASKKQGTHLPQISREEPTGTVAASSEKPKKFQDYQNVIRYDMFGTATTGPAVSVPEQKIIKSTELDLKLKGTVVGENRNSYAIILDGKANKEDLYYLNDFVQGARIVQVFRDRVVIEQKGVKEVLLMEEITEPSPPVTPKKKTRQPRKRTKRRRPIRRR